MEAVRLFELPETGSGRDDRALVWLIILFWIAQIGILTGQRMLMMPEDLATMIAPRSLVACGGMAISYGILRLMRRQEHIGWMPRLGLALLFAAAGALLHAEVNYVIFNLFLPRALVEDWTWSEYLGALLQWFWGYLALTALLMAGVYSRELRERERRLAELRVLAHSAQVRALRYQLNPHFMFNTLNSIASLIASGQAGCAEHMVENLSDFLRAALATDPGDDLPLEREIELQRLYLAIEALRFADRLKVSIDVPEDLRRVPVPSLILQPLVENAIKHGVARRDGPTLVEIAAERRPGAVQLTVRNTLPDAPRGGTTGEHIGLFNVERRLLVRYDSDCGFTAAPDGEGRFEVRFVIPVPAEERAA